ncbi:hypothetical protein NDU88_007796 [Pleurodeles waltl]|uniref:Uncharacterized protein n=1 Tax=Pleurodeles waltl TaxID=8319 RepID=A0AAV7VVE5_PLEWA|nr:hypothetical protein NDU88_007796 [Pleurodeles waltl]
MGKDKAAKPNQANKILSYTLPAPPAERLLTRALTPGAETPNEADLSLADLMSAITTLRSELAYKIDSVALDVYLLYADLHKVLAVVAPCLNAAILLTWDCNCVLDGRIDRNPPRLSNKPKLTAALRNALESLRLHYIWHKRHPEKKHTHATRQRRTPLVG